MKVSRIIGGLSLLLIAGAVLAQSIPQLITYQGRLTGDTGAPVNGTVDMVFKITDQQYSPGRVTDEQATLTGFTEYFLAHNDLVDSSEVVTSLSGNTTYQVGTDYYITYATGGIIKSVGSSIPDGDVLVDYEYNIFLYVLWSETISGVDVDNGIYHVTLGGVNPIPKTVFNAPQCFLEVNVNGELLEPRQRITSTAYAFKAGGVEDGAIGEYQLADSAVTSAKISDGTITGSDIDSQTITSTNIADDTITSTQISDGTITGSDIDSQTITSTQIANQTITGSNLQNDTLGTDQIQDIYVLSSGDTVNGDLRINGNIGVGIEPGGTFGMIIDSNTLSEYGAMIHGSAYGVYGKAVGNSTTSGIFGYSENDSSTDYSYGVVGQARNTSSFDAFGGYFRAEMSGTGSHHGVHARGYADSSLEEAIGVYGYAFNPFGPAYAIYGEVTDLDNYAGYFHLGKVRVGNWGTENYIDGTGDLYLSDDFELGGDIYYNTNKTRYYSVSLAGTPLLNMNPWRAAANKSFCLDGNECYSLYSVNLPDRAVVKALRVWGETSSSSHTFTCELKESPLTSDIAGTVASVFSSGTDMTLSTTGLSANIDNSNYRYILDIMEETSSRGAAVTVFGVQIEYTVDGPE